MERGLISQSQLPCDVALVLFAFPAHGGDDVSLRVDLGDVLEEIVGLALDDGILL